MDVTYSQTAACPTSPFTAYRGNLPPAVPDGNLYYSNVKRQLCFEGQQYSSHPDMRQGPFSAVPDLPDMRARGDILAYAFQNLLKMFRLSDELTGLLLNALAPEEYNAAMDAYEKTARGYARTPRALSNAEIARQAKIVLDAADEELSSDEIADILNLDVMAVEKALSAHARQEA